MSQQRKSSIVLHDNNLVKNLPIDSTVQCNWFSTCEKELHRNGCGQPCSLICAFIR